MFGVDFKAGLLIGVAVGALTASLIAYPIGTMDGRIEGRQQIQTEIAVAAAAAERARIKDDAQRSSLTDRELCSRSLRARGMSDDGCAGL